MTGGGFGGEAFGGTDLNLRPSGYEMGGGGFVCTETVFGFFELEMMAFFGVYDFLQCHSCNLISSAKNMKLS